MLPVNGSLHMAPLFSRSGPGESSVPDVTGSIEVLRLPVTPVRSLICFASGVHATLLGSCLAACACAPGRSEGAFRARVHVQPATRFPACSHVDVRGPPRFPGDPSCAFASVQDPGRINDPSPICRSRRCCPRFADSEGFSVSVISGLSRGFSTCCLRFKNGVATTHAKLASGWLACLYREGDEPSGSL